VNEDATPRTGTGRPDGGHEAQFGVEVSWKKDEIDALTPRPQRRAVRAGQGGYEKKETQVGSDMMRTWSGCSCSRCGRAMEGPLAGHGPSEGRHRSPRIRPEGSTDRVQAGRVEMFEPMELRIARDTVSFLMKVQVAVEAERAAAAGTCRRCRWRCRAGPPPARAVRHGTRSLQAVAASRAKAGRTIPAHAAAERNTRSAAGLNRPATEGGET